MILEGQFVRLRPIAVDDADATFRWRHGKRARFLQAGAQTVDQQRQWIAGRIGTSEHNWIIEYRGVPVGMCALHDINHTHHSAIFGRLVIGEREAVGAAPVFFEAERLLCDFAFRDLHMHKLYGGILDGHATMLRTREYLGYHQDGILRDHLFIDGQYRNWIAVSLLDHEYEATCRPRLMGIIDLYGASVRGPAADATGPSGSAQQHLHDHLHQPLAVVDGERDADRGDRDHADQFDQDVERRT